MIDVCLALMAQADSSTMLAGNWDAQTRGGGGGWWVLETGSDTLLVAVSVSMSSCFLVLVMH